MRFLHFSDIHFRHGVAGHALDVDSHLRNEVLRDVSMMTEQLGAADLILISGDIAYGGKQQEYAFALQWLTDLSSASGSMIENVFACPGNHDVDRGVASAYLIQSVHEKIRATTPDRTSDEIWKSLVDSQSASVLYAPLISYNDFAVKFLCALQPPHSTLARRTMAFPDGSTLELYALNSALVSDEHDSEGNLFVDSSYYQIQNFPGVVNLVMCHHPFTWLGNGRTLKDHIESTARIHVFGHEHSERVHLARDFVRIAAAATQPSRMERGWQPGYNWLELEIRNGPTDRWLDVTVHVRLWQTAPDRFVPKLDNSGEKSFRQSIRLESWTAPSTLETEQPSERISSTEPALETLSPVEPSEREDAMSSLREVSLRFFELTLSQKSAIAGTLGLLEDEDSNQPDYVRFRNAIIRARERNQVKDLEREIDTALSLASIQGDAE